MLAWLRGGVISMSRTKWFMKSKPRAVKDLKGIDRRDARRIVEKIKAMRDDLAGDIKRLTNSTPEYRLRVGHYRALFEVEGDKVVIYRVRHRKDAYS
jgi:mRNA interferase RelE/StbE